MSKMTTTVAALAALAAATAMTFLTGVSASQAASIPGWVPDCKETDLQVSGGLGAPVVGGLQPTAILIYTRGAECSANAATYSLPSTWNRRGTVGNPTAVPRAKLWEVGANITNYNTWLYVTHLPQCGNGEVVITAGRSGKFLWSGTSTGWSTCSSPPLPAPPPRTTPKHTPKRVGYLPPSIKVKPSKVLNAPNFASAIKQYNTHQDVNKSKHETKRVNYKTISPGSKHATDFMGIRKVSNSGNKYPATELANTGLNTRELIVAAGVLVALGGIVLTTLALIKCALLISWVSRTPRKWDISTRTHKGFKGRY